MKGDARTFDRALVTGGAGFIGGHLVQQLSTLGVDVLALDSAEAQPGLCRIVRGSVSDSEFVEATLGEYRPDVIFHLAANASVPISVLNPVHDFNANAVGTLVLLDAVRRLPVTTRPRVILASSGAVYGEPVSFPIREENQLSPISPYGCSKLAAEELSRVYTKTYGLDVVIARIFNSFGPRMPRFVIYDFLKKLAANPTSLEILGTGFQVRDFTYVTDTVAGLLAVASSGSSAAAYNVSSGVSHNLRQVAEALLERLGLTGTTRLEYTGASWAGDAQRWEVSIDRLTTLGFTPAVSFKDGLDRTVKWFETTHSVIHTPLPVRSHGVTTS